MSQQPSNQTRPKRNVRLNIILWVALGAFPAFSPVLFLQSSLSANQQAIPSAQFQPIGGGSLSTMSRDELDTEKIRQEILKIDSERKQQSFLRFTYYGSLITAVVAAIGLIVTIKRTFDENIRQREADRRQREQEQEQRERERKQQEVESLRRLNENFATAMRDLGSEKLPIQAGAAISLLSFLKPECTMFHEQLYRVVLANLKKDIKHVEDINHILIQAFERILELRLIQASAENCKFEVALTCANLERANLSGLNLSQTDLALKTRNAPTQLDLAFANLQSANLTGAHLERARGLKVNLKNARLSKANLSEARLQQANLDQAFCHGTHFVAADLKKASLKNTQFQQARLQSAHLEKADLRGARFEQANLADAFFRGAKLNDSTRKSILKAYGWRDADFSPDEKEKLHNLANQNSNL